MNIVYVIFGILFCCTQEAYGDQNLRHHLSIHKTHDSYSKSHNPITDFIFGILLVVLAIPFLWYNERRQAITQFRLDNASKDCLSINSNEVNPNMEGKLVHMCGISSTNELVGDPEFGVSEMNLIKLDREVEMYQWIKKTRTRNKSTETYYVQQWSSEFHDSSDYSYGHQNEKSKWIIEKKEILNKVVYLGQYLLSESLKSQVTEKEVIKLNTENVKQAQSIYGNRGIQFISELNNYIHFQQIEGQTVNGDLRVQFFKYNCGENTIVSQQSFNTFRPYMFHDQFERTVNEDHFAGTEVEVDGCCFICHQIRRLEQPIFTIDWIFHGLKTQNEAFGEILKGNIIITICVRLGGYLVIAIGLCLFFSPITYIVTWIPLLGNVLGSVTVFVFGLISFTIALPITLLVISLAWVWYRPKIGIVLILIAGGIGAGIYYYLSKNE